MCRFEFFEIAVHLICIKFAFRLNGPESDEAVSFLSDAIAALSNRRPGIHGRLVG